MPRARGAATTLHDSVMRPEGLEPPRVAPQDPKSAQPGAASTVIDGHQREWKELRRPAGGGQDTIRPMCAGEEGGGRGGRGPPPAPPPPTAVCTRVRPGT